MTDKDGGKTKRTAKSHASASSRPTKPAVDTSPVSSELLPGEEVDFEESDEKKEASDEELNSRYVSGEVRIVTESARYSLAGIRAMLEEKVGTESRNRYDLDPEYQRRHRWSREQKSRLIESFLMNIPVPPIFLYERDYAQFEVMDGRQRLTALDEFYRNEFALEGLEYWKELNGKRYENLPGKVRDGIDRRYISSIILLKETAKDEQQAALLKKLVFERLNSGGVALSPQETRNALHRGPLNDLCLDLSNNKAFRKMWQIPENPRSGNEEDLSAGEKIYQKMEDVELVLRFFAYRHLSRRGMHLNNISMILDRVLAEGNRFSGAVIRAYQGMFEATISLLWESLGEIAFCRFGQEERAKERPTKIVYDPLMWVASRYAIGDRRAAILKNRTTLRNRLANLYLEDVFGGRRTNAPDVKERNERMSKAFADVLGMATD